MADIKYVITVDSAGAVKNVENFDKAVEALGKQTEGARGKGQSFGQELSGHLIPSFTAASLAADAIKKSLAFVKDQIVSVAEAGMEAERVDSALNSALAITGRTVPGLAEDLSAYASELQRKTIYDDEAIKKTETLLAQMTDLDEEGIKKATRSTVGLASALGIDLDSAAMMVTKAMEGNFQALQRYGIKVDETLPLEEKRAALMEKLEGLFQRATAQTNTAEGSLAQMRNTISDAKEKLGNAFLPAISAGAQAVGNLVAKLAGLNQQLEDVDGRAARNAKTNEVYADTFFLITARAGRTQEYVRNLATLYNYNYETLIKLIGEGAYGKELEAEWNKERAGTIAKLKALKDGWAAAEKGTRSHTEATKDLNAKLSESDEALEREIRWLRMLGSVSISAPVNDNLGSLGDMIGGMTGQVVNFTEKVPGLFEGIKTGTADAKTEAEGMASVWDAAMQSMTAGLVSFGDANATVVDNVGKVFSNFVKSAISGIEAMVLKYIWESKVVKTAKQGEAQSGALASIFGSMPWFVALPVAAGSFAIINALFSKILKFEQGGVFTKPTIAEIGHGTEYVLPEKKLIQIVQMAQLTAPAAAREGVAARSAEAATLPAIINLYMDGKQVGRALLPSINKLSSRGRGGMNVRTLVRSEA
ncbi:MAG: hypothetical protein ABFD52_08815 [Acidobacteriota bacterium]